MKKSRFSMGFASAAYLMLSSILALDKLTKGTLFMSKLWKKFVPAFLGANLCLLLLGCPTAGGLEITGSIEGMDPSRRYSASVKISSENVQGHTLKPLRFQLSGNRFEISFRGRTHFDLEIAFSEDDTIRCILMARLAGKNEVELANKVNGDAFKMRIKSGIIVGEGVAVRVDRSAKNLLEYNLGFIETSMILDTVNNIVHGGVDTIPANAKLFLYPLGRHGFDSQPIEIKAKKFRINTSRDLRSADLKFISNFGWIHDIKGLELKPNEQSSPSPGL